MAGFGYTDPYSTPPMPTSGGGGWKYNVAKGAWEFIKDNAGDILQTGAGVLEGYMSSADRAKQLEEMKRQYDESLKQRQAEAATSHGEYGSTLAEQQAARAQSGGQFERTTGDTEAQAAVRAQTQINAAPMADKAQALLLKRMGVTPGAFQPRDYTQGDSALRTPFTAPGQNVATQMQQNAQNYKAGDGGVDTSTVRMLLEKMKAGGFKAPGAGAPPAAPETTQPWKGETESPYSPMPGGRPTLPSPGGVQTAPSMPRPRTLPPVDENTDPTTMMLRRRMGVT